MREFLKTAFLFLTGLAILFGGLSVYYHYRIYVKDNFVILLHRFMTARAARVVFLGDSHVILGINQQYLGREYYNFAYPGSYRDMYLKLKYIREEKPSVRYVVIPLDYNGLSAYTLANTHLQEDLHFAHISDICFLYYSDACSLYDKVHLFAQSKIPLLNTRNRLLFVLVLKKDIVSFLKSGKGSTPSSYVNEYGDLVPAERHTWTDLPLQKRISKGIVRANQSGGSVESELVRALDALLTFARANNIALIGIRYPLAKEYQDGLRLVSSLAAIDDAYRSRADNFVKVLDYRRVFDDHQEYFSDADHLNEEGARIFTHIITTDIDGIVSP